MLDGARTRIERLAEHPEEIDWRVYFFFDGHGVPVGSGGFQGLPDKDRAVEIGYETPIIATARFGYRCCIGSCRAGQAQRRCRHDNCAYRDRTQSIRTNSQATRVLQHWTGEGAGF